MALTVTTTSKYIKATDGQNTTYIPVAGIDRIDAVTTGSPRVIFNGKDPQFQQYVTFTLYMKDIATFGGSAQFTADSIATAIVALL